MDYEQKDLNYVDLYILGSAEKGRKEIQIINRYDPCCFYGVGYRTYVGPINEMLHNIDGGQFEVYDDTSIYSHDISPNALNLIIKDMES